MTGARMRNDSPLAARLYVVLEQERCVHVYPEKRKADRTNGLAAV